MKWVSKRDGGWELLGVGRKIGFHEVLVVGRILKGQKPC